MLHDVAGSPSRTLGTWSGFSSRGSEPWGSKSSALSPVKGVGDAAVDGLLEVLGSSSEPGVGGVRPSW